jgi:hypothetical protein
VSASRALELPGDASPLEVARTRRGLSRAEAAARAALSSDEVTWLEEGRLYRFRTAHHAAAAAAIYTTALGVDHREALEVSGRPLPPRTPETTKRRLFATTGAIVALVAAVAAVVLVPRVVGDRAAEDQAAANLPPPWRVEVDVLNGSGDINYTRQVADRINSMAYRVERVGKATRFDYPQTAVYYPPAALPLAERLAEELCVPTKPLPGGDDPRRLVVIVGPASVGGC